jgi:hypothetical protein
MYSLLYKIVRPRPEVIHIPKFASILEAQAFWRDHVQKVNIEWAKIVQGGTVHRVLV